MNLIKKISVVALLVVSFVNGLNAQAFDSLMHKAYLLGSHSLWEAALMNVNEQDPLQKAVAYYGILNNTMISSNEENFDKYVDQALGYMQSMKGLGARQGEALAFQSAIYGFIMGYSPWKGMFYGPKSSSALEEALSSGGNSPIVHMISGTSLYYTPEAFGGDKRKAVEALEKALKLFELQNYRGWLYLNTLGILGEAHIALSQKDQAIRVCKKALEVEPEFKWVSMNLLPSARSMKD